MTHQEKTDLSRVRLERAFECLSTARENCRLGDYRAAANRAYYAVFHAIRAVLAMDEIDMSKHSAVISEFRRRYLKTDILDRRFSGLITDAFEIRNESDYDDFYIIVRADVEQEMDDTQTFLETVRGYLARVYNSVNE
ncbi:MAG: HEPN domain-containing protein [Clostridia bacterium]|nr:HEPN domain-containing protein [Clostridia bacterium]MBR0406697.1 HEPN domain-containing protein [Clostridia bacterium]